MTNMPQSGGIDHSSTNNHQHNQTGDYDELPLEFIHNMGQYQIQTVIL